MAGSARPGEDSLRRSLNVPVPGPVLALAEELRPALGDFARVRDRHTLVVKRLDGATAHGLGTRVRQALSGAPAVEARVTGVDGFELPVAGAAPVAYLAVESPGLRRIHETLCEAFEPVEQIEGDDYVPHVTLARGGGSAAIDALDDLRDRDVEPVTWTVGELLLWDARTGEPTGRIALPA